MGRHSSIVSAASNLLGICFLIITGLTLTKSGSRSLADEIAWVAAVCFLLSIALSYIAIRNQDEEAWQAVWGDRVFMVGVATLTISTMVLGIALR